MQYYMSIAVYNYVHLQMYAIKTIRTHAAYVTLFHTKLIGWLDWQVVKKRVQLKRVRRKPLCCLWHMPTVTAQAKSRADEELARGMGCNLGPRVSEDPIRTIFTSYHDNLHVKITGIKSICPRNKSISNRGPEHISVVMPGCGYHGLLQCSVHGSQYISDIFVWPQIL